MPSYIPPEWMPLVKHSKANWDKQRYVQHLDSPTYSISTVLSGSVDANDLQEFGIDPSLLNDGKPTLIPFVWDGAIADRKTAIANAIKAQQDGTHWPAFENHDEATYASKLISSNAENYPNGPVYKRRGFRK